MRNNLQIDICTSKKLNRKGRTVKVTIEIVNERFTIINIYASPEGDKNIKQEFFRVIRKNIRHEENVVIGGDFNCIKQNNDKLNYTQADKRLYPNDLIDIWRDLHPQRQKYTYTHSKGSRSRLDRFITSKHKQE